VHSQLHNMPSMCAAGAACAPHDPNLLALIEHVAPVEPLARDAAKEAVEAVEAVQAVAVLPRWRGLGAAAVMLARRREPRVVSELANGLLTLPSRLSPAPMLAMVCEAIVR
jgi:hypothetical protein